MEITTKKDVRLIGRAIREGWPVTEEMKERVVAALVDAVESRDPKLMIEAADKLLKADKINIDRESLHQRQIKDEDDRRLQLLEIAKQLPVGELAKLASDNGIVDSAGTDKRSGSRQTKKRKKASRTTRPKNTATKRTKSKK